MRFWKKLFGRLQREEPKQAGTSVNTKELIAQGNSLKGEGKYVEAEKCFKQVLLNVEPRNEKAWFFLADTYTWAGVYGRALASFEQVLALNPNNTEAEAKVRDMKPMVEGNQQHYSVYITEKEMFAAISRFNFTDDPGLFSSKEGRPDL